MNYKFKVGDKVTLVGPSGPSKYNTDPTKGWFGWSKGDIAQVVAIDPDPNKIRGQNYVLERNGLKLYWHQKGLKIITEEV